MADTLQLPPSRSVDYADLAFASAGAEAVVFSAKYLPAGMRVAIKVLRTPGATAAIRARREERFRREARALWGISHAHVARVYEILDVALDGESTKAFTMEWLPSNLQREMGRHVRGLPVDQIERLLREALEGL